MAILCSIFAFFSLVCLIASGLVISDNFTDNHYPNDSEFRKSSVLAFLLQLIGAILLVASLAIVSTLKTAQADYLLSVILVSCFFGIIILMFLIAAGSDSIRILGQTRTNGFSLKLRKKLRRSIIAQLVLMIAFIASMIGTVIFLAPAYKEAHSIGQREQLVRIVRAEEIYKQKNDVYTKNVSSLQDIDDEIDSKGLDIDLGISNPGLEMIYTATKPSSSGGYSVQGNTNGLVYACKDVRGCRDGIWDETAIRTDMFDDEKEEDPFPPDPNGNSVDEKDLRPNPAAVCPIQSNQKTSPFSASNPDAYPPTCSLNDTSDQKDNSR